MELTDVDDTSVAVEFLHSVDSRRYAPAISSGCQALCTYQGNDGGFPTYRPGAPSEAGMTAAAINALSTQPAHYQRQILAGARYLLRVQHDDGLFDPNWSRSRFHAVFRAVLALKTTTIDTRHAVLRSMRAVTDTQNPDGGWGQQLGEPSDAISTAYALICLCHQDNPRPAIDATRFLLAAQRDDGGIESVPDMLGTRPFLYTIPCLADHFTLLALAHLNTRMTGPLFDYPSPRSQA